MKRFLKEKKNLEKLEQILDVVNGKRVAIFGTSPHITRLFCHGINVPNYVNVDLDDSVTTRINELSVNLTPEAKKYLAESFCEKVPEDIITVGLNLFPCFFPCDIALWGDLSPWLAREIINKSMAEHLITSTEVKKRLTEKQIEKITDTFIFRSPSDVKNIDREYCGYVWWRKTIAMAAIHLFAMGHPEAIYIGGVDLDPMESGHFYENVIHSDFFYWCDLFILEQLKRMDKQLFPNVKFYKLNHMSYLPYDYVPLERINEK